MKEAAVFDQTTNKANLVRLLDERTSLPYVSHVIQGVMRLTDKEANGFLSTLLDIRDLPMAA